LGRNNHTCGVGQLSSKFRCHRGVIEERHNSNREVPENSNPGESAADFSRLLLRNETPNDQNKSTVI
ncbi:hypothetical protein X975_17362, partial [Stegodyphus mimosarum]